MRIVWAVLLGVGRTLYLAYALWCVAFPLAAAYLLCRGPQWLRWLGALVAVAVVLLVLLKPAGDTRGTGRWQEAFLAWFGTLRVYRNFTVEQIVGVALPSSFLVENPRGYRLTGKDVAEVLEKLQAGDILLRGHVGYVDGAFIRMASKTAETGSSSPAWFTHAALYAGTLDAAHLQDVPAEFAGNQEFFSTGTHQVIHATSKGVHVEDLLTFLRCDYLAILRLPKGEQSAMVIGEAIRRTLKKIGRGYDFDVNATSFDRFTCSELVYYAYRGPMEALGLMPREHALYPLRRLGINWAVFRRTAVIPDNFHRLAKANALEQVWADTVSRSK